MKKKLTSVKHKMNEPTSNKRRGTIKKNAALQEQATTAVRTLQQGYNQIYNNVATAPIEWGKTISNRFLTEYALPFTRSIESKLLSLKAEIQR